MPIEHIEVEDFVCCKLKFHAPVIKASNFDMSALIFDLNLL